MRALVTGGSRGLGRAIARGLLDEGWEVIVTGRDRDVLAAAVDDLPGDVVGVPGDVADGGHRAALVDRVGARLDLLVNNASTLGQVPRPHLRDVDPDAWRHAFDVNVVSPVRLATALAPALRAGRGLVVQVTSDAGTEAWAGWGVYGSSKAALDHASRVLAEEEPGLTVMVVDPGDLRTDLHQAAFPGEDIGDRPEPATVVPAFLAMIAAADAGRHTLATVPS